MTGKSQKVFNEVGYNLSEEVKNLIESLDFEHGTSTDGLEEEVSSLKKDITEYQAEVKRLEKENSELKEQLRYFEGSPSIGEDDGSDDSEE